MYPKYELKEGNYEYNLDTINSWININGNIESSGILLGGCIECIKDIIGTKYDYVNDFIENNYTEYLLSEENWLKDRLVDAKIHTEIMGSDHCPVSIEIEL